MIALKIDPASDGDQNGQAGKQAPDHNGRQPGVLQDAQRGGDVAPGQDAALEHQEGPERDRSCRRAVFISNQDRGKRLRGFLPVVEGGQRPLVVYRHIRRRNGVRRHVRCNPAHSPIPRPAEYREKSQPRLL